ncbi:hypothetical protein HN51_003638 [Arachis hypogaea]|uniref:Uncharacterized protein LOC107482740 n=1 Tax=Arachis duranensis TaxID=130453 RepID=A0A6P4CX95_ARADU|nr:uncharacterized protein LOC107482740 [Arachis duranensis]XP_025693680.1 uncharacterized protein LOC112795756 [Arachis hypogaea]QHO37150.1 uncharacterized protein DS421_4g109080 [Arachis hypogaea]
MSRSNLNSEKTKGWNIYTASAAAPSSYRGVDEEAAAAAAPWKGFGTSSMSAISFGFVATAILISMFVIMAIFEHLFKPSPTPHSHSTAATTPPCKQGTNPQTVEASLSVLMPGQQYPTYIAQPAPLPSCPREQAYWPSHDHNFLFC